MTGIVAALSLITVGCGSGQDASGDRLISGEITVSAASSLTEAFTQMAKDFDAQHPGTKVNVTFDSSSTLASQIVEGAPADVFASADEANMTKLADQELVTAPSAVFARNDLVIVTRAANLGRITSLQDLSNAGVISLCAQNVPCGRLAAQALGKAGVTIAERSVTRGQNAKATLTAVSEGDAVAGIVYATDARAARDAVKTVAIAATQNVVATYPIAVLANATNATTAKAFVAYVLSEQGLKTLKEFGFLPPA